jgi:hypothetical protein
MVSRSCRDDQRKHNRFPYTEGMDSYDYSVTATYEWSRITEAGLNTSGTDHVFMGIVSTSYGDEAQAQAYFEDGGLVDVIRESILTERPDLTEAEIDVADVVVTDIAASY